MFCLACSCCIVESGAEKIAMCADIKGKGESCERGKIRRDWGVGAKPSPKLFACIVRGHFRVALNLIMKARIRV